MSVNDNGGPAFPCMPPQDTAAGVATGYPYPDAGMTLRDYFAAKAMQAIVTALADELRERESSAPVAAASYAMADAMLAERAKVKP